MLQSDPHPRTTALHRTQHGVKPVLNRPCHGIKHLTQPLEVISISADNYDFKRKRVKVLPSMCGSLHSFFVLFRQTRQNMSLNKKPGYPTIAKKGYITTNPFPCLRSDEMVSATFKGAEWFTGVLRHG